MSAGVSVSPARGVGVRVLGLSAESRVSGYKRVDCLLGRVSEESQSVLAHTSLIMRPKKKLVLWSEKSGSRPHGQGNQSQRNITHTMTSAAGQQNTRLQMLCLCVSLMFPLFARSWASGSLVS